jgi:asparagine synthase (glutamine-hydrolysing)
MGATIVHRGPDHTGEFFADDVGLVMNRLAIIDLKGGNQPFVSADGMTVLIYNGEIYNFKQLRAELESKYRFATNSDTEVILHGYAEWGRDVLARLNGIFAIAILDRRNSVLLLARDPLGTKPLYFLSAGGTVYFASEIKAFTATRLATDIDTEGICQFLAAGYVFCPYTGVRGVKQVEAGTYVQIRRDGMLSRPYRPFPDARQRSADCSAEEWLSKTRLVLSQTVVNQTLSDVPYGLLLSSGTDSMAILAMLKENSLVRNLETFTVAYEEQSFSEGDAVARLAKQWGYHNTQIVLTDSMLRDRLDDLFYTFDNLELLPTAAAIHTVSELAGQSVRVLLSGNGGDELFGGYPTYRATQIAHRLGPAKKLLSALRRLTGRVPTNDQYLSVWEKLDRFAAGCQYDARLVHFIWRHVFLPDEIGQLLIGPACEQVRPESLLMPQVRYLQEAAAKGYRGLAQLSYADLRGWLVDHGLTMWDKAGMRWSAEIRVPLVDPNFVDYVLGIPAEIRMRQLGTKAFLRRMLRGSVPDEILELPKHGFQVPISRWLRGPLGRRIKELSLELPKSHFDRPRIETLWRDFEMGRGDNALRLWTLGCVSGWAMKHRLAWN